MFTIKITFLLAFFHNTDKLLVIAISDVTQNVYHITFERAQDIWFDKTVYENFEIVTYKYTVLQGYSADRTLDPVVPSLLHALNPMRPYKTAYNRTVASYNLTSTLRIDVPSFKVNYRCYKFSVNEYKLTAIQFEANGCALLKFGKLGAKSLMINSNFTDCPLKRGTYGLYNANIDSSKQKENGSFG